MADVGTPPSTAPPAKKPKPRHVEPLLDLEVGEWADKIEFNFPPFAVLRDHSGRVIVGGGGGRGRTGVPNKLVIIEVEAEEVAKSISSNSPSAGSEKLTSPSSPSKSPSKTSKHDKTGGFKPGLAGARPLPPHLSGNVLMRTVCRFDTGEQAVMNMALHPRENLLAVGVEEKCRVYNIGFRGFEPLGEVVTDFAEQEEERGQKRVRFEPNGQWIATTGGDGCVRIFAFPSLALIRTLPGHSSFSEKESVDLSCTSTLLVVTSRERCLVYDIRTGKEIASLTPSSRTLAFRDARFCPVTPPPSRRSRTATSSSPSIASSQRKSRRQSSHSSNPSHLSTSEQNDDEYYGNSSLEDFGGSKGDWDSAASQQIGLDSEDASSAQLFTSNDAYYAENGFLAGVMPPSAKVTDSKTKISSTSSKPVTASTSTASATSSKNGNESGASSSSKEQVSSRPGGKTGDVVSSSSSASSPSYVTCDTRFLYTTEFQPQKMSVIRKWDVRTWKCVASTTLKWTGDHHTAFSVSPDGHTLALGSVEGQVRVLKASNLREAKRWKEKHEFFVTDFAFAMPPSLEDNADGDYDDDYGDGLGHGAEGDDFDVAGEEDNSPRTPGRNRTRDSNAKRTPGGSAPSSPSTASTLSLLLPPSSPPTPPLSHQPILFSTSGDNTLKATMIPHITGPSSSGGCFRLLCCCGCFGSHGRHQKERSNSRTKRSLISSIFRFLFVLAFFLLLIATLIVYLHANHSLHTRRAWKWTEEMVAELTGETPTDPSSQAADPTSLSFSRHISSASSFVHDLSHTIYLESLHTLKQARLWIQGPH